MVYSHAILSGGLGGGVYWSLLSHMYHRMYPTSPTERSKPSVKYDLQIQTMGPALGYIPAKQTLLWAHCPTHGGEHPHPLVCTTHKNIY